MRPWLWMPSGLAHRLSPLALQFYARFRPLQTLTWSPFEWRGIQFSNRLGIAGGVDKDAEQIQGWWALGVGFIEVGTVTPLPQTGNKSSPVARNVPQEALWNRLGFPSKGAEYVAQKLKQLYQPRFTPLFANVGKNASTPLEKASEDYKSTMRKLREYVDGFVINISSPNTAGLRDLLQPENLKPFLSDLIAENQLYAKQNQRLPLLLKISPDLPEEILANVLDVSAQLGIDGWILTNSSQNLREGLNFPPEGGVSGRPLAATAKRFLGQTVTHLRGKRDDRLIISVGGVMSETDVFERLEMGADLVQVYSALIFRGPQFFRSVAERASLRVP